VGNDLGGGEESLIPKEENKVAVDNNLISCTVKTTPWNWRVRHPNRELFSHSKKKKKGGEKREKRQCRAAEGRSTPRRIGERRIG